MKFDFKLSVYEELCSVLIKSWYKIYTLENYVKERGKIEGKHVIMRHDVDRNPHKAYLMAKLENTYGINSTYYFRLKKMFLLIDISN